MFHSVILVDPAILRRPRADEPDMNLADYLAKKRDIWSSREEAMQFFRSTKPHKTWNERNLEIYVVRLHIFLKQREKERCLTISVGCRIMACVNSPQPCILM